jgi:hypothetical protein
LLIREPRPALATFTRLASAGRTTLPEAGRRLRKDTDMSDAPAVLTAAPQQQEILRQALADAIY